MRWVGAARQLLPRGGRHALVSEGRTAGRNEATQRRTGRALCACGAWSADLPSAWDRKQWHLAHLAETTRDDHA